MTAIDLTARAQPYSLYLPAMQPHSALRLAWSDGAMRDGRCPKGIRPSDFNFLNANNKYWHYAWCLATAGHFKDEQKPNAITHRSPGSVVVGDSGGFQIGMGTMREPKGWMQFQKKPKVINKLWSDSDAKRKIVNWLDAHCDLAMTIDIPLWVTTGKKPIGPFGRFSTNELTALSVDNLKYISNNRGTYGNCKYLNVLQGSTEAEEEHWFQAVKGFQFEGWSFAGGVGRMGGIYRILRRALLLRDLNLLDAPYDWLHILMLSKVRMTPLMTAMERAIRKTTNPNFKISYDSSSPYQTSGKGVKYATVGSFGPRWKDGWSISPKKFPTGYDFANMSKKMPLKKAHPLHLPVALDSPIAKLLTVQDINIKKGEMDINTLDAFSDEVLINHNVYTYITANILANESVFGKKPTAPQQMMDAVGIIEDLFKREDWHGHLTLKRTQLSGIAG